MKREVFRGQNTFRFVYFRYKDSPYFSLLILFLSLSICIILIFQIIIPQTQNWFSIRDEVVATRQKIAILRSNALFMSGLNKAILESNRQIAIRALPVEKDFGDIINAIAIAAVNSGVSVDDFSFTLGRISTTSAEFKKQEDTQASMTRLSLSLRGDMGKLKSFVNEISEKLPLNEIESIDTSRGNTYISLYFYSKPYMRPRISYDESIHPLSPENSSVFSTLSKWNSRMSSYLGETQQPPPPSSGVPLF